jgi:hypothetical protein
MTDSNFTSLYTYYNTVKNTEEIKNMVKQVLTEKNLDYSLLSFLFNTMLFYNNISTFKELVLYAIQNNIKSKNLITGNLTIWNSINFKEFLKHEHTSMLESLDKQSITEVQTFLQLI